MDVGENMFKNIYKEWAAPKEAIEEATKKDEGNAFTAALMAARKNGDSHFVVAGKRYKCEDYDDKGNVKEAVTSADKKPENYTDKDGKTKTRMIPMTKKSDVKKEKMDPVGREDGDVDNDGDKDASDKYLLKRRKAISKNIAKDKKASGKDDTAVMNPKKDDKMAKEEADPDTVRMMKANPKMQKTGGPGGMKGLNKKAQKDTKAALKKEGVSVRDKLMSIWEKAGDHAQHTKGATKPDEQPTDRNASAKKMKDGHGKPQVDDTEEKGHDDASKAGRAVASQAKARNNGDNTTTGDRNIVNKIAAAYKGMQK